MTAMASAQQYWMTSFQPTGNRWAGGCNGGGTISIKKQGTTGTLEWVVGSQTTSTQFLGLYSSGKLIRFSSTGESITLNEDEPSISSRPLVATGDPLMPVLSPPTGSIYSNAIPIATLNTTLYVDANQVLQLETDSAGTPLTSITDPLIDAHITYSPTNEMWALYTSSTTQRYDHGILGDRAEGYHLHVLKKTEDGTSLQVANEIILEDDNFIVFEDLAPVWTDVDRDGIDDLLTTIATKGQGAALRVYLMNADGSVKKHVQSDYIGTGNRWLHKVAHAPTGPNGEWEIIDCRTPHIGGIVRYWQYDAAGERLSEVKRVSSTSYTSHLIGSRNIDQALVADLNGDGIPELVIQNQRRNKLIGLQRTTSGDVEEVWCVPLDDAIHSNFAVSCAQDGEAQLVFGTVGEELYTVSFSKNNILDHDGTMGQNDTMDIGDKMSAATCPSCMTQLNGILSLLLVVYHMWLY